MTMRSRVAAGAALLDKLRPGWEKHIDRTKLDLGDAEACIIGQLEGSFHLYGRLGISFNAASAYGFNFYPFELFYSWTLGGPRRLTRLWKQEIL